MPSSPSFLFEVEQPTYCYGGAETPPTDISPREWVEWMAIGGMVGGLPCPWSFIYAYGRAGGVGPEGGRLLCNLFLLQTVVLNKIAGGMVRVVV